MAANPERKILVLALIGAGMVTMREIRAGQIPPAPHAYAGVGIVYGSATVIAELAGDVGLWLAVAWTLWLAYGLAGTSAAPAKPKPNDNKPKRKPKRGQRGQRRIGVEQRKKVNA